MNRRTAIGKFSKLAGAALFTPQLFNIATGAVLVHPQTIPIATAASGGFAEVGSGSQRATKDSRGVSNDTLAFPGNIGTGHLLIVGGAIFMATTTGITSIVVTDTRGTSYTVVSKEFFNDGTEADRTFIAYGVSASGGANTVTVTINGTASSWGFSFSIDEFSGQNATPFSVDGGQTAGTSSAPADSITTATANELVIAAMNYGSGTGNDTIGAGGGFTLIGSQNDRAGMTEGLEFRIVTTATSYSGAFTLGSSRDWAVQTASFKI